MARTPRNTTGNMVYHVLNRANGRMPIFRKDKDYQAFVARTEAKNGYTQQLRR